MANVNVEFAKHKHLVILSPRAYGDLDYKQRTNWSSQKGYNVKGQTCYLAGYIKDYITSLMI